MKKASCGEEYQKMAKEYVVNMVGNRKMLHKKNRCYHSKFLYEYLDFDSFEEAETMFPKVAICQKCFPLQKDEL